MNLLRGTSKAISTTKCLQNMATILDDKSKHCIPFILSHLQAHQGRHKASTGKVPPFFVGLQGVQGAGKTTLVETLCSILTSPPHGLQTLVMSIDDLYLKHEDQKALAQSQPGNPLIQHRGQPSTHDVALGRDLFDALQKRRTDIELPCYDKSAFSGAGDRKPSTEWRLLNRPNQTSIDVVVLEGWCVGFKALSVERLERLWQSAKLAYQHDTAYKGQLGKHDLSNIKFVNDALRTYDVFTDHFSCFIQLDAEDPLYVYEWRLQQEDALHQAKGSGMTHDQVVQFVNGYYPAYELYTSSLRAGIFDVPGAQLRLVIDRDRKVSQTIQL